MFSDAHRSGVMVTVIVRVGIAVSIVVAVGIDSGVTTLLPQPDRSIVKIRAKERMSRIDFFMQWVP
jgi:hypothetical protein